MKITTIIGIAAILVFEISVQVLAEKIAAAHKMAESQILQDIQNSDIDLVLEDSNARNFTRNKPKRTCWDLVWKQDPFIIAKHIRREKILATFKVKSGPLMPTIQDE